MIQCVVLAVTYRCNCQCIMCSIPERNQTDLPISFYETLFLDPIIKDGVSSVNVTGGEPFLRKDLPQIIDIICERCTRLFEIVISTNGTIESSVDVLKAILEQHPNIYFRVSVSVDAIDSRLDYIRGFPSAFTRVRQIIAQYSTLAELFKNMSIIVSCTITKKNYDCLFDVYQWAQEQNLMVDFIYATVNEAFINSAPKEDAFRLNQDENIVVFNTVKELYELRHIGSSRLYYQRLLSTLRGEDMPNKTCPFQEKNGILIEADATARVCGMAEKSYLGDLRCSSVSELYHCQWPDLSPYCANCLTNSYVGFSKEAREQQMIDIMQSVKKMRTCQLNSAQKVRKKLCELT